MRVSPLWRLPGRGRVGGRRVPHHSRRPMPRAINTTATIGPARLDLLDPLDQDSDKGAKRGNADERVKEGRDDVEREAERGGAAGAEKGGASRRRGGQDGEGDARR